MEMKERMSKEFKLKIDKKLEAVVPHLKEEDYIALRNSIKEKGLLKPIDVMSDGTIVDGHHRYKACRELKFTNEQILTSVLPNVKTIEDALKYSFDINFARRQLTDFEKMVWYRNIIQLDNESQQQIADKLGMVQPKVSEIQKVLDNSPKPIIEKVRQGKLGWTRVHKFLEEVSYPEDKEKKKELLEEFKEYDIDAKRLEEMIEECKPIIPKEKQVKEVEQLIFLMQENEFETEDEAVAFYQKHGGCLGEVTKVTYWQGTILSTRLTDIKKQTKSSAWIKKKV